jgi:hypothetical protein
MGVLTSTQFPFLLLHQAIEFVEQLAISFRDRVHDASEHGFNLVCTVTEQTVDHVLLDSAIELVRGDKRGIQKRAAIFAPRQKVLFEQPVERGHERGVSDPLLESPVYVAHAHLAKAPRFFEHLTFEFAQSQAGDFTWTAESAQQKARGFHGARIFGYHGWFVYVA